MSSPRRALIVIDVQNEYFTGRLPIEYPPVAQSLPKVLQAMDAAHARGIPVIVVQHSAPAGAPVFVPGADTWELHPEVARRPRDHYIGKSLASAFTGTDLADWLAARGIDTLTVVGYMTHNCDASTIYEGAHRGLRMEFLHDATGALPYANAAGSASAEEIHRVFSVVFHSNFAAVASTADWIAALDAQAPLPIDNVPQSNQRARDAIA
ncbi:cysteine hydrolase family protein [Pseudoxanthomonas beigongshangi]